jgi:hypothetical protein
VVRDMHRIGIADRLCATVLELLDEDEVELDRNALGDRLLSSSGSCLARRSAKLIARRYATVVIHASGIGGRAGLRRTASRNACSTASSMISWSGTHRSIRVTRAMISFRRVSYSNASSSSLTGRPERSSSGSSDQRAREHGGAADRSSGRSERPPALTYGA